MLVPETAQTALEHFQWRCDADDIERERVRVQCRPTDGSPVVIPFAYRTPNHARGENITISWGTIRVS